MNFDELLRQVSELLKHQGRVSYGRLKRRFSLDDDHLQDQKDELIHAQSVATDENGKVLIWTDKDKTKSSASVFQLIIGQNVVFCRIY